MCKPGVLPSTMIWPNPRGTSHDPMCVCVYYVFMSAVIQVDMNPENLPTLTDII